jgi:hypothetical protein
MRKKYCGGRFEPSFGTLFPRFGFCSMKPHDTFVPGFYTTVNRLKSSSRTLEGRHSKLELVSENCVPAFNNLRSFFSFSFNEDGMPLKP